MIRNSENEGDTRIKWGIRIRVSKGGEGREKGYGKVKREEKSENRKK